MQRAAPPAPTFGHKIGGRGKTYFESIVIDNLIDAFIELAADVWTTRDRMFILESVLVERGIDAAALIEAHNTLLTSIRAKGYATQAPNSYTAVPGKTSSIGVPVLKNGEVKGAMALVFFAVSMPMAEAEARFVDDLKQTSELIGRDL
ncbi:MAG: hypothetical protein RQ833_04615 [Sphingomonadaceae bacterium]|nr:hypothetical protein [Sphingomonadaceae bacterium]